MPDPEDAPPQPPTDFVAWMSAEMPEVAASGRRIERRHLRLAATRPSRWRSVRRLRSTARRRGRDWGRWLIAGLVLVLAAWGVVVIVHPFGLGLPSAGGPPPAVIPATSAPVPSESAAIPSESAAVPSESAAPELFPAHLSFSGHTADRVATVTDTGCRPGPGVPEALARVILDAGDCRAIRVAEYVDLAAAARMAVATVEMSDPGTAAIIPLVISEHLIGPSLVTKPPAQTIFAGVAGCSATVGFVGSAARVAGAQTDYQALADETEDLMRQLAGPSCGAAPS